MIHDTDKMNAPDIDESMGFWIDEPDAKGGLSMITIRTPNDVDVLMHCYTCPEVHPRITAGAVIDTYNRFIKMGVIEEVENGIYKTTELGDAWVSAILNTRLPKRVYVDENGAEILLPNRR